MLGAMARNWWALALRGVLAIIFGILLIFMPGLTLEALVLVFGAYALVNGVFEILSAFRQRGSYEQWWVGLLEGIVSIIAGIAAILLPPAVIVTSFVLVLAAWAIFTGVMQIIAAIQLRKVIDNELMLGIGGALSILFGVLAFLFPGAAILTGLWLISAYAILFGILMILLAFRLKGMRDRGEADTRTTV